MKKINKMSLIIIAIVVAVILLFVFSFQIIQNNNINYKKQITTAQCNINIQKNPTTN